MKIVRKKNRYNKLAQVDSLETERNQDKTYPLEYSAREFQIIAAFFVY